MVLWKTSEKCEVFEKILKNNWDNLRKTEKVYDMFSRKTSRKC